MFVTVSANPRSHTVLVSFVLMQVCSTLKTLEAKTTINEEEISKLRGILIVNPRFSYDQLLSNWLRSQVCTRLQE